ncbi:MAG: hypothetical protein Q9175_003385 [Cornicularia normoerica]
METLYRHKYKAKDIEYCAPATSNWLFDGPMQALRLHHVNLAFRQQSKQRQGLDASALAKTARPSAEVVKRFQYAKVFKSINKARISDGICAIQPFLVPGKASAHVAPINTYVATATVIQRCVGGNPSTGGQVRDFGKLRDLQSASVLLAELCAANLDRPGGDNNLLISVTEYDPDLWSDNVHCFGSTDGPGIVESCNGLADRMDASKSLKSFGPQDLPHDYVTPYTLTAGEKVWMS